MMTMTQQQTKIPDLRKIHYITENYTSLQGLRIIPLGILVLLQTVMIYSSWSNPLLDQFFNFVGLTLISFAQAFLSRYYQRRYGMAQPSIEQLLRVFIWFIIAFILMLFSLQIETINAPVINVPGIALAFVIFLYWWPRRPFAIYYLALSILLLLSGFLPLTHILAGTRLMQDNGFMLSQVLLSLTFIIGGLCDHLVLTHSLTLQDEH